VTPPRATSVFAGFRFPPEVIPVAVRWYLRYGLSDRDVEELLAERGATVDHVTVYRRVQRFTPEFIEAARPRRHAPGDRWLADETYVKAARRWTYLYWAVDQHGQVTDVLPSVRRDLPAARRFFIRALHAGTVPAEVTTDRAPVCPRVLDELVPSAMHTVNRHANNPAEADHRRLKARLRPMRGSAVRDGGACLIVGSGACGPQRGPADPVVVAAQQQVDRVRAAGGRRHHHGDHRPGWAAAGPLVGRDRPAQLGQVVGQLGTHAACHGATSQKPALHVKNGDMTVGAAIEA